MRQLRACYRFASAVLHLLVGLITIMTRFPRLTELQRQQRIQIWSATMLQRAGIHLTVIGHAAQPGPLLLVANHISWLDITALHAARFCRFVSKADVKEWPVIGRLATGTGSLFIERTSRRDAMRVVHHMTDSLRAGDVLAVFPEGTTSDGTGLRPFHGNLLQAAISADAPIQPVSIRYINRATGQRHPAPCYINDDTLLDSVWRTLCASDVEVEITFGHPQTAQDRNRRAWAVDLQNEIGRMRGLG